MLHLETTLSNRSLLKLADGLAVKSFTAVDYFPRKSGEDGQSW